MRLIARAIRTQSRLIWKCLSSSLLSPLFQIKLRWHRWLSLQCPTSAGGGCWASRGHTLSCWCVHRHGPGGLLLVGFLFPALYSHPAAPRATRATSLVLGHRHPPAKPGLRLLPELGLGLNISNRFIKKKIKIIKGILMGIRLRRAL